MGDQQAAPTGQTWHGDDLIGRAVGNYRVTRIIGEGGMGRVYEAIHPVMGRKVAVKVLLQEFAQHKEVISRFFTEARAAHEIHHPNIVDVLDLGHLDNGTPYLVMELLDGQPLSAVLQQQGVLNQQRAARILRDTAMALAAAHAHGVIHRDLKPDNIFLVPENADGRGTSVAGERVKILDFGVAKLTSDSATSASHKTMAGTLIGTPFYMSPEQCQGRSDIDHRTDIYALGAILYEILVGKPPFQGQSFGEILIAHSTQPPQPPSQLRDGVAMALEQIVLRCLEKAPANRFASMEDLAAALDGYLAASQEGAVLTGSAKTGTTGQHNISNLALGSTSFVAPTDPGAAARGRTTGLTELPEAKKPKTGLIVGSVLGVLIVGGAAVMALRNKPVEPPPAPVAKPPEPPVKNDPPPPPPAPKMVNVVVTTEPSGARVLDQETGKELGVTNVKIPVRKGEKIAVRLEKDGYVPVEKIIDPDDTEILTVPLVKLPTEEPPSRPGKRPKRPKADRPPVAEKQPPATEKKPVTRDEIETPEFLKNK